MPIIPDLPLFVAHDNGLFAKHGLDPELIKVAGSGNQVLETLSRGSADLAYLAYSTVLEAQQQAPGSFVMLHHNVDASTYPGLYALVASPASNVKGVADLRGKSLGTFPGAAMLVLTQLMLTAEGVGRDEVTIAQLAPPAQVAALKTGQVDALLALEPIGAFAVDAGAGVYVDRWPLTPRVSETMPSGGSVMLQKTYQADPGYVRSIAAALDEAIDVLRANPAIASALYVKYCDVPEAVAPKLPVLHFWKSGEVAVDTCQRFSDLLHREGVLGQPLDVRAMYPLKP